MQSILFKSCFGVFQGGGARAVALAGAYQTTYERGIRLSEVAGTSAGSIAAVLLGAGATPEFLLDALRELDFKQLLCPPDTHDGFTSTLPVLVGKAIAPIGLFSEGAQHISRALKYGGCYSSRGIEEWVEKQLQLLLPHVTPPVRFRHLYKPTYVVATNLATKSAQVWSTYDNKEDSVALAVRASCSIPIFFQPVLHGNSRLVDGGMLSNLPAFVFGTDPHRSSKRILAYRLQPSDSSTWQWTPKEMLTHLIDTVVGGATELQVGMQRSVSCIEIPTLGIKATDFHKIDKNLVEKLLDSGRKAAEEFVASQAIKLRGVQITQQVLRDRDEVYLFITRQSSVLPTEVLIAETNTQWYWQIFPTILYWRVKGVPIKVLLQPAVGDSRELAKERSRRANLLGIGAHIVEVKELPLQGYVFSRQDQDASSAILFQPRTAHGPIAVTYQKSHQQVIQLIYDKILTAFRAQIPASALSTNYVPQLLRIEEQKLCETLKKGVSQYNQENVTVTWERVTIAGCRTITKLIREYKYEQMLMLVELFKLAGIPLFSPVAVTLAEGKQSLMCPPVFEIHGNLTVGVEGNTRTYYAYTHGLEHIYAAIVRGVSEALPGQSVDIKESRLIDWDEEPRARMPGFQHDLFRRIEGACHPHR